MIRDKLNQLIEDISRTQSMDRVYQAKKEYHAMSGEIFEDDVSYEARMGLFLEWFAFDYPVNGARTPLEQYLEQNADSLPAEDLELFQGFQNSRHSLFLLKKNGHGNIVVLDLFEDEKLTVQEDDGRFFFNKDDVFEARLLPFRNKYYFTENFCHHPKQTYKYIASKVHPLRKAEAQDYKTLKKMNKDWTSLKKELDGINRQIEKVSAKIEKTYSESKQEKLQKKLGSLKSEKVQLEIRYYEQKNKIADWEANQIQIGHRAKRFQLMKRLSYMSLKWERYHNVDVRDIYRD